MTAFLPKIPQADNAVHVLSVSGGKDSTAMYLFAMEHAIPFHAVFADTGNEHEITLDYIRHLPSKTGGPEIKLVQADFQEDFARKARYIRKKYPEEGISSERVECAASTLERGVTGSAFFDCCLMHGLFPGNYNMRFCTTDLKYMPISEYHDTFLRDGKSVISWVGVRAEESAKRAKLTEIEQQSDRNVTIYRPLLRWTLQHVLDIHTRHGLELNPLYHLGMSRVGCCPCINSTKEEIRQIAKQFPERIEMIRRWEEQMRMVKKTGTSNFFRLDKTPRGARTGDASYATIDHVVAWSKSKRGSDWRQKSLDMDDHSCMSALAACE